MGGAVTQESHRVQVSKGESGHCRDYGRANQAVVEVEGKWRSLGRTIRGDYDPTYLDEWHLCCPGEEVRHGVGWRGSCESGSKVLSQMIWWRLGRCLHLMAQLQQRRGREMKVTRHLHRTVTDWFSLNMMTLPYDPEICRHCTGRWGWGWGAVNRVSRWRHRRISQKEVVPTKKYIHRKGFPEGSMEGLRRCLPAKFKQSNDMTPSTWASEFVTNPCSRNICHLATAVGLFQLRD